jgi:hypothetical protein
MQSQDSFEHGESASLIPKKSDRFAKSSYKDVWATVLWLVFLVGFAILSILSLKHLKGFQQASASPTLDTEDGSAGVSISVKHIAGILLTAAAGGFLLSLAYFLAMRR